MSYIEGIAQQLSNDGFGTYSPTAVYTADQVGICLENMPTQPNQIIGVFGYSGGESDIRLPFDQPSIQVRVRGDENPMTSRNIAEQIYNTYHGKSYFPLPSGEYVVGMIGSQSGPIPIGRDENGRHEHTVNFRLMIRNPSLHRV